MTLSWSDSLPPESSLELAVADDGNCYFTNERPRACTGLVPAKGRNAGELFANAAAILREGLC